MRFFYDMLWLTSCAYFNLVHSHIVIGPLALDASKLRNVSEKDYVLGCVFDWRLAEVIAGRLRATRLQLLDIFAHEK